MHALYHQLNCLDNRRVWTYDKRMKLIFGLVLTVFLLLTPIKLYAQETTVAPSNSSSTQMSKYVLPYPGMLPDNKFYKLKLLRDKLILTFITNPTKKIEFYVLQADKQTAMIPLLISQNKKDLAAKIALRAEDNITQITYAYKSKGSKPTEEFYKKLESSIRKHQEVYSAATKTTTGENQKTFQQVLNFSATNREELRKIYTDPTYNSLINK